MDSGAKSKKTAVSEGVAAGLLFGTASIFIRAIPNFDPLSIALWRLIIASIALFFIILIIGQKNSFTKIRESLSSIFVLGTLIGIHFALFTSSVKETTILNATVLVNTSPIMAMIVSVLFFSVKPRRLSLVGLSFSLIGILVIGIGDLIGLRQGHLVGDLEAISASLAEAFYLNLGRKIRNSVDLSATMFPIFAVASLTIASFSLVMGDIPSIPIEHCVLLLLIGLGLLPTALGHSLYFSSLSNLKSFETATLALIEPVGATILGMLIFNEIPGALFVFGSVLVLSGVVLVIGKS